MERGAGAEAGGGWKAAGACWAGPALLAVLFAAFRLAAPQLAERPELAALDAALQWRARLGRAEALDSSIRFVEMDYGDVARSAELGGEYALVASVIRSLAALGPGVVAVDVVYHYGSETEQHWIAEAVREVEESGRTRVVLAASASQARDGGLAVLRSLPDAGGQDLAQGLVNVEADRSWREYRLVHHVGDVGDVGGETLPSLAMAAYAATLPASLRPQATAPGRMEWRALGDDGEIAARAADDSRLFLDLRHSYYDDRFDERAGVRGRVWTLAQIEALAAGGRDASPLLGAVVFLGYGAGEDGRPTAHGPMEPGMVLHATALNDLIAGSSIRPAPRWLDLAVPGLAAALAGLAFAAIRRKRWLVVSGALGLCMILAAGTAAVWHGGLLLPSANAGMLWGAAFLLEGVRRWGVEQRVRLQREAMLGFYFSPSVLRQVTRDLGMIRPRGAEVAVLLSDLRAFTTLCETQPVENVFELLNRLFSIETEAALREDGSLARFAGDQFLAYWGAPEPCSDPAGRALRAALEIVRELSARQAAPGDELDPWLRIGIGLHCGRGLVGHVGSRSYRDYNIVGDSVNTTARIEAQTKNYGAAILASGEFIAALGEPAPPSLRVDRVRMKGKAQPTDLHAVFAPGTVSPAAAAAAAQRDYEAAFSGYLAGDFAAAAEAFAELRESACPTVAASARRLHERCASLAAAPPADWDGAYILDSK